MNKKGGTKPRRLMNDWTAGNGKPNWPSLRCIPSSNGEFTMYDPTPEDNDTKLVVLADKIIQEFDHLGTLDRDIEAEDWVIVDALSDEMWKTPARSIRGVVAKARVLDHRFRENGKAHSVPHPDWVRNILSDLIPLLDWKILDSSLDDHLLDGLLALEHKADGAMEVQS
jgi:hypothetical protein